MAGGETTQEVDDELLGPEEDNLVAEDVELKDYRGEEGDCDEGEGGLDFAEEVGDEDWEEEA